MPPNVTILLNLRSIAQATFILVQIQGMAIYEPFKCICSIYIDQDMGALFEGLCLMALSH